ncbi:Small ubiquitin-related modifier [Thalictrum thalictroides]|uniref:Small ubiquitin-related modifier n=1 Tax=Thalictrum thalictroides TaxID=46969 RepID=A0A7J6V8S6_THATH|nr:Small ubiquitin-related modifier [Thalictrum thalictroides]
MASLDIQVQDNKTDGVINSNPINLKVKGQDGQVVNFRVKKTIHLGKLMSVYCQRQSLDIKAIVFLYDGRYIKLKNTPAQLEMEDGDEIDAMLHQTSG